MPAQIGDGYSARGIGEERCRACPHVVPGPYTPDAANVHVNVKPAAPNLNSNSGVQTAPESDLRQAFEWDPEGNLLLYTDAAGRQTRFEYTGENEIVRRINRDGTTVAYEYDTEEQLVAVINEKGQTHRFEYDTGGRPISQGDYHGNTHDYQYDKAGHLLKRLDPLERTTAYTFDPAGRMIQKRLESGACETFAWDKSGLLIAFESPDTLVERTLSAKGTLIAEKMGPFWAKYQYNAIGLRTRRTSSVGNRIDYTYDANGHLATIAINGAAAMRIERDRRGQITAEHLGGKLTRTNSYDTHGRLVRQRSGSATECIERNYQYDLSGNLLARQDSHKGTHHFSHDPMDRIIASINSRAQLSQYQYDPVGDFVSHPPGIQKGLRTKTHQGRTYRYDASGNLYEREQDGAPTRLGWDENNRLRSIRTPDKILVRLAYDAIGRRSSKIVNGERTSYFWEGDALLAEQFEDAPAREYVYYPGTFEPLALIDGDKPPYYYHNAINGLPCELTRLDGEQVWSATYDALGRVERILVDEVAQPLRMQGQYWDAEIGLSYNRHRYFDPHIGAFISQNPVGLAGGVNTYAYAPNPWEWSDPLGLSCFALENTLSKPLVEGREAMRYQKRREVLRTFA